ncbi:MAG: 3-methyl-2-oxobutanoate hydroxymethyltransferase [Planctomycetota bacterium]|jgi:3-methyl-2-oxobutanoate hydroxymethyltransferase
MSRITITDLIQAKQAGSKISAISCYDYTTAALVAQTPVQMILVGDSAAQLMLGFDSTLPAKMDFMVTITAAVRRGAPDIYLVADMPFLSYQIGLKEALINAGRFITEAGAQMVKIEADKTHLDMISALSNAGIAVMAHIGIRPQSITKIGRFKAEATTAQMALELIALAEKMVQAGASSLLLEGTAAEVSKIIAENSEVPVISCGSGPDCDGQILIAPDILGLSQGKTPKFVKAYGDLAQRTIEAIQKYSSEIEKGKFPDTEHSYHMKPGELDKLKEMLRDKS